MYTLELDYLLDSVDFNDIVLQTSQCGIFITAIHDNARHCDLMLDLKCDSLENIKTYLVEHYSQDIGDLDIFIEKYVKKH